MGVVYKAHDARLGRHVALKFLSPHLSKQPASKQRFLVEARAAAALDHPHICTILEIGETEDGQLFIAMPLYDGETVQARLKRGRLPFDDADPYRGADRAWSRPRARGRRGASRHQAVERHASADGTVKILDFGIASTEALSAAPDEARFGTLAVHEPGAYPGAPIDRRSDIWSLGVLVHEMLTGARPFDGDDSQSLADAILNREPDLVATSHPDVPAGMDRVLRRALAKQVEDRYPSMGAFAADLTALLRRSEPSRAGSRFDAPIARSSDAAGVTERRRAAVLVTMVSEYGVLVESLTPVDAERLVAQIRDLAVDIVRRHGGHVNQAIGEEIVSVFGVVAAHDDDELRAVRAALELHARVRALAAEAGWIAKLRIQSGLHVGSVVAQRLPEGPRRYAVVGAPSHLASRLAALAAPDEVVLSPECQRLLSPFVDSSPCAAVVLEPGAPAVTPFRVTGQTGLETRLEASEQLGLTPYVGRANDLALLERCVERGRSRRRPRD